MAGRRNPLIDVGGRVILEKAHTSAMTYTLTRSVGIALFASEATRARENISEKTRSMGAARHSGAGRCVAKCGASWEDFSRSVETAQTEELNLPPLPLCSAEARSTRTSNRRRLMTRCLGRRCVADQVIAGRDTGPPQSS